MSHATPPEPTTPDSEAASVQDVPTSFGVFNPVGWLMLGQPTQASADAVAAALHAAGWPGNEVLHFVPKETLAELEEMVENAGGMSGFGYEITLLARYVKLTKEGYRWLLAKVDSVDRAAEAAGIAKGLGATLAVHYRMLITEELI